MPMLHKAVAPSRIAKIRKESYLLAPHFREAMAFKPYIEVIALWFDKRRKFQNVVQLRLQPANLAVQFRQAPEFFRI